MQPRQERFGHFSCSARSVAAGNLQFLQDFQAKAKPITFYKGSIRTKEFWIGGFSNQYGPIDRVKSGDRYIVFLKYLKPTTENLEYWQDKKKREPQLSKFYKALKAGNAYTVWTPTSGDLRVIKKKVQYDLLQTTFYTQQSYHSFTEFETFLKACLQNNSEAFHKQTIKKLVKNASNTKAAQYLMMLYLTSFQSFNPVYQKIASESQPEPCFALAKLLGQVKGEKARDILVQLLDHKNGLVQGEAVRQLADEDPEFIGPILLARFDSAGNGGYYPTSIMNPIENIIQGGKIEMIYTFGKLKYKPAAKVLVPLLEIENEQLFELVVETLVELDSKDYIPYIKGHLKKKTKSLISIICDIIVKYDLKECKPALMDFIATNAGDKVLNSANTIPTTKVLAYFDDEETIDFLLKEFEKFLKNGSHRVKNNIDARWIERYIEAFVKLKVDKARPLIYTSLHDWFGINYDFVLHPELITIKQSIEDSTNQKALQVLEGELIEEIRSVAIINNTAKFGAGFVPEYDISVFIKMQDTARKQPDIKDIFQKLDEVCEKVSKELNIPLKLISSECYTGASNPDNRFDKEVVFTPMHDFYKYAIALPNNKDLKLLKVFAASGCFTIDYDKEVLAEKIKQIEEKLKQ